VGARFLPSIVRVPASSICCFQSRPHFGEVFYFGGEIQWNPILTLLNSGAGQVNRIRHQLVGVGVLLLGVLVTLAIYWPGLHGAFFFDDYPNIVLNPGVRLENFSGESIRQAFVSGISGQFGRPFSQLAFALNFHSSGFDPFAFKLTNLVIHCLNGILIYLLAYQLLDSLRHKLQLSNTGIAAALVAVAWMIHPIQLTSVLYVVQRMTGLSASFLLLALIFHVLARRRKEPDWVTVIWFVLAWCVFWPLSILSKETGVLLPGFVAVYELIVRRSEREDLDRFGRAVLYVSIVWALSLVPFLASSYGNWILSGYNIRSFSLVERLLTEPRVIWGYLQWIAFPRLESFALFHDDFAISTSLFAPWTTLPTLVGLLVLAIIAVTASRKFPLVAFGVAWFLIGHSLESSFIPLELVHEHRNYLPLFGVCLLPVGLLGCWETRQGFQKTLIVASLGAMLAYFGLITAMRANMFGQEQIRTQLEAQFHPGSARTNYEAGRTLAAVADADRGNLVAAILGKKHFEMATELDRDYKMGLLGMLVLNCGMSQTVDRGAMDELTLRLKERLILQEDTSILSAIVEMSGAGLLCLTRSDIDRLFAAFVSNPGVSQEKKMSMYSLHADYLWLNAKDLPAAREALHSALEIAPLNPSVRLKLAQLDFIAGEKGQARTLLLELRSERLAPEERKTLDDLLGTLEAAQ
jgi:protein O-mannosyl-transferase